MSEVNFGGLFGELGYSATGIFIALLERLEGGGSLAAETERGGDFGPIELERCTSLEKNTLAMTGWEKETKAPAEGHEDDALSILKHRKKLQLEYHALIDRLNLLRLPL